MELNITKQTVSINDLSFKQNVEQSVDFSVNIPDYCGSVQRILKYHLEPRVCSKSINGQTLTVDGNAHFSVIFIDESNHVSSYDCVSPFSKNIDLGENIDYYSASVKAKCGYVNAKAITSSRIDVAAVVELSIKICSKKTTEIISDIDCSEIFANKGESLATSPVNCVDKNIIIEDEIIIPSDYPSIFSILRHDSHVEINDTKIVNNKVIAKGELHIHVLYSAENRKNLLILDERIPFSQIIDIDGINDGCEAAVTADIISVDIKPRSNYDGEIRSIALCAKIYLCADAVCNNSIAVIYDAYSSKYDTVIETRDTTIEKVLYSLSETFDCQKKLEFSDGDVENIIDIWSLVSFQSVKTEEKHVVWCGNVVVCGICENREGTVNYFERPIDFEYRSEIGEYSDNIRIEPLAEVMASKYNICNDGTVDIVVTLSFNAKIIETSRISLLTDLNIKNESSKHQNDCSVIIYYAERGEHTWNIAKRFNASPNDIMAVNSVSSIIPENMPLVISC